MIKTVVTPQKNSYNLTIPTNYIGRKVEILLYALDEVSEEKTQRLKNQWLILVAFFRIMTIKH